MKFNLLTPLVCLSLSAGSALAAACPQSNAPTQASLGMVTRKTPLYNEASANGERCPRTGQCGTHGYLIAGDPVVVWARQGGWACIEFTSTAGRPTFPVAAALTHVRPLPDTGTLAGTWTYGDQRLFVRRSGGQLLVRGWASWPWEMGASPETRRRILNGGVNVGQVNAAAPWPASNRARLDDGGCELTLRALGPYLLVQDNFKCGGQNVSFQGVYRRSSATVTARDWNAALHP